MAVATKKIDIRASEEDKELLTRAAHSVGRSLSQFVLEISRKEARHILADENVIELSDEEWEEFRDRLDSPERDLSKLVKTLQTPSIFADA